MVQNRPRVVDRRSIQKLPAIQLQLPLSSLTTSRNLQPKIATNSFEARIVLDSGSQRSYIIDHAKTQLSLTSEGEQRMSIMTFGSSEERSHVCDTVRVGVVLKDSQPKNLALCTIPLIILCEPLASQPIVVQSF